MNSLALNYLRKGEGLWKPGWWCKESIGKECRTGEGYAGG